MDLKGSLTKVLNRIEPLSEEILNSKYDLSKGIDFFDVKSQLMISYMMFNTIYMLYKINGQSIKNEGMIKRMLFLKEVFKKLQPVEKKLEYQINKLLRMAQSIESPNK